jgi:hypothetical protein
MIYRDNKVGLSEDLITPVREKPCKKNVLGGNKVNDFGMR